MQGQCASRSRRRAPRSAFSRRVTFRSHLPGAVSSQQAGLAAGRPAQPAVSALLFLALVWSCNLTRFFKLITGLSKESAVTGPSGREGAGRRSRSLGDPVLPGKQGQPAAACAPLPPASRVLPLRQLCVCRPGCWGRSPAGTRNGTWPVGPPERASTWEEPWAGGLTFSGAPSCPPRVRVNCSFDLLAKGHRASLKG